MSALQLNAALDREIRKIRGNEKAMQKMVEAARMIRLMYVSPMDFADFEAEQERKAEAEAERQFRSLRGCWANDPEGEEMYQFMRSVRDGGALSREISFD